MAGGRGADGDGAAAADRTGGGVRRCQRLAAGGLERDGEGADAAGQRRVGRQDGGAVAAGEVGRAAVGRGGVVEGVQRGHRHSDGAARGGAAAAADREVRGGAGLDGDGHWCR